MTADNTSQAPSREPPSDPSARVAAVLTLLESPSELQALAHRRQIPIETLNQWRRTFVDAGKAALGATSIAQSKEQKELNEANRALVRTELNDFEQFLMVPTLRNQLTAIRDFFVRVRDQAQEADTRRAIFLALEPFLKTQQRAEPRVEVERWLGSIVEQCDAFFIARSQALIEQSYSVGDVRSMTFWAVEVRALASAIITTRATLFRDSLRTVPVVRDELTGEPKIDEPKGYIIAAYPFELVIDQASNVAKAVDATIESWSESLQKQRASLMEFWSHRKHLKGARTLLAVEIVVLLLSLSFIFVGFFGSDFWGLNKRNQELASEVAALKTENDGLRVRLKDAVPAR